MANSSQKSKHCCSPILVQEYLDGELPYRDEAAFESHLSSCKTCLDELNLQKSVLGILDHDAEPVLPADFAAVVAMRADSQVTGLRRTKERIYAFSIVAFLILAAAVLLAFDISRPIASFEALIGKFVAFLAMIGSVLANIAIGMYVVAKVFAQPADRQTAIFVFVLAVAIAGCSVWAVRTGRSLSLKEAKR